jgi:hypothetical protein
VVSPRVLTMYSRFTVHRVLACGTSLGLSACATCVNVEVIVLAKCTGCTGERNGIHRSNKGNKDRMFCPRAARSPV